MPYSRHQPELTVLHQVVRKHLGEFLRTLREEAGAVPQFITRAWRSYLDCGLGGAGFARLRCESCLHDHIVCFSCKTRQLCPSCAGRAMADGSAHLVDRVIPDVKVRQYVLAFPFELWGMLAYQPALVNAAQKIFCDSIQKWHRQRAREYGFLDGKTGGVAVLHRFGSALNVTPHIHALLLDGVYTPDAVFHPFNPPDAAHLEELCHTMAIRVLAMLKRHGALKAEEKPNALLACTQLALFSGDRVGGDEEDTPKLHSAKSAGKLRAVVDGFNLEATTTVEQGERIHRSPRTGRPRFRTGTRTTTTGAARRTLLDGVVVKEPDAQPRDAACQEEPARAKAMHLPRPGSGLHARGRTSVPRRPNARA